MKDSLTLLMCGNASADFKAKPIFFITQIILECLCGIV